MQITINLPDDTAQRLAAEANHLGLTLEEHIRTKLDGYVDDTNPELEHEADYLLKKNAELYRRLA